MVYRISISEDTMERMRKYVRVIHKAPSGIGKPGNSKYGYTVEDIVCELLSKEGF
jgi:NADH/NAD ratio-sensing transcriptional regulator Rex